jgi:fructan beta-fructosidase
MGSGPHVSRYGAHDYAAQTYSDIPSSDGRRIQISWMSGGQYPGMPFNQQMTVPRVLTLRTTPEGIRLFMEPVKEIEKLRGKPHSWKDLVLGEAPTALEGTSVDRLAIDCLDIEATFEPGAAKAVGIELRGHKVEYVPAEKRLKALGKDAPLEPVDGRIHLRILVDRTSVEVFANHGRVQMASCCLPAPENKTLAAYSAGGAAKAVELVVWELRSIWRGE